MKQIWEWLDACELHFCRCHEDYKKRNMISPECDIHDIKLELIELLTEFEQLQSNESPVTTKNARDEICPVCSGEKRISDITSGGTKPCPHCGGTGKLSPAA